MAPCGVAGQHRLYELAPGAFDLGKRIRARVLQFRLRVSPGQVEYRKRGVVRLLGNLHGAEHPGHHLVRGGPDLAGPSQDPPLVPFGAHELGRHVGGVGLVSVLHEGRQAGMAGDAAAADVDVNGVGGDAQVRLGPDMLERHGVPVLVEDDVEVQVHRASVDPVANLERHLGKRHEERRLDLVEHELAAAFALLEGRRVVVCDLLGDGGVQLVQRGERLVAQLGDDGGCDVAHRPLHRWLLLGLSDPGGHDGAHVVAPQGLIGLVEHDLALAGVFGDAGLEVVADASDGYAAEELVGMDMAKQPGVLPHVRRGLDVCVLRVGQGGDEQVGLADLAGRLAHQLHGRARPVHLHDLAWLVLEVVGDVAAGDVPLVSAAKRRVADGGQALGAGLVAILLPKQLLRDADPLQLGMHVAVVGIEHRRLLLRLLREQQVVDGRLVHLGRLIPGQAGRGHGLEHLLRALP